MKPFSMVMLCYILASAYLTGCQDQPAGSEVAMRQYMADQQVAQSPKGSEADRERASHVMLIINTSSEASIEIGAYYKQRRQIPTENVVVVGVSTGDSMPLKELQSGVMEPIRKAMSKCKARIDYLVTTKGMPLRVDEGGYSVDAFLMTMNLSLDPIKELTDADIQRCVSPYFEKNEHFSSAKYHMYLTTRLEGYTTADCKALVDHSLQARPVKGPFFFDDAENRKDGAFLEVQKTMKDACDILIQKGFHAEREQTVKFVAPSVPLMGYCSWGSNDGSYDAKTYHSLKFLPGAIAETFVSTSGRTFHPNDPGQSQIGDLVAQGVTGAKGYVSEPYTFSLIHAEFLFYRYTSGYNLAESFYMASPILKYRDIVIGDPLCNPYAK